MVEPGSVLGGKYRVGRVIGSGGMGVIVEAEHLQLGTLVAIKVLRANYTEKPEVGERFLREARAAAQLRNEHICRVHDYGTLDDGAPFMVMELLEGRDLGTLVDQEGPLAVELVAHYVLQTCSGIAEPHARGMIHRDLKPANLFLERKPDGSPSIKILDFGIAKFETVDFKLTETTSVVGSPSYMAPEQLRSSKGVDTRTDIWALGVVMYELLTEKQPFTGESMTDLALNITGEQPAPLPDSIYPDLASVVMRCIEKDPAKRFQDVAALAEALTPYARLDASTLASSAARMLDKPNAAMKVVDELLANQTMHTKHTTLHGATGALIGRRALPRATIGVLALAGALAVVVVEMLMWPHHSEPARTDEPIRPIPAVAPPADAVIPLAVHVDAAPPTVEIDADIPADAALPPPDAPPAPTKHVHHHGNQGTPTTRPPPDLGRSRY